MKTKIASYVTHNGHVFFLKRVISLQLDELQWTYYNHNEPIQLNR